MSLTTTFPSCIFVFKGDDSHTTNNMKERQYESTSASWFTGGKPEDS
ncbi:hypothetical protein OMEGA_126 [Klebsiella phage vB_KaeM_KaOmega]|nr:hypothetical protein OMEGA_126 [Klebsiella phage vB_KaeM_KaOmega]